jgi:hypothetical protein
MRIAPTPFYDQILDFCLNKLWYLKIDFGADFILSELDEEGSALLCKIGIVEAK